MAVERLRLLPREDRRPVGAPAREVRVARLAGGGEQVGVLRSHLVRVDEQERVPLGRLPDAPAGLGVDPQDPVAVEVEVIVIAPPPRPVAGVQERLVVDVRSGGAMLGDLLQEALPAVRVHHRVDQYDDVLEQLDDRGVEARRQVINECQGAVRARRFVAVDRVGQPGGDRQRVEQALGLGVVETARIGQPAHAVLDLVQARHVLRRGDDHVVERAALVALGVLDQSGPRASLVPGAQSALDLGRKGGAIAGAEAEDLLLRRDAVVVLGAGKELDLVGQAGQLGGGRLGDGGGGGESEGEHDDEAESGHERLLVGLGGVRGSGTPHPIARCGAGGCRAEEMADGAIRQARR